MTRAVTVINEDRLRSDLSGMARAAFHLEPVLERQARRTAEAITGIARGSTGKLAAEIRSPRNRRVTSTGFEIGVGTFYGHMVFGGTSHSAPEPPKVPADVGRETARLIGDYLVRHRHGAA
jgi:hypothetical protein